MSSRGVVTVSRHGTPARRGVVRHGPREDRYINLGLALIKT